MSASLSAHAPVPATAAPHLALVAPGAPSRAIRVVVVHQRRIVRAGLRALLERDPGITVVGEAASALELQLLGPRVQPDVLLVGSPALAPEQHPDAATLVLSDELADAHPAALDRAVKGAARRRPQPRTPRLKLIQGGSSWNSAT